MQFIFDISAEDDDPNGFIAAADRGSGPETEAREPTDKVPKMRVITLIYNKTFVSEDENANQQILADIHHGQFLARR